MTTMAAYQELWNGDQKVHFTGEMLSRQSSEYGLRGARKGRWTEITIYRADDGKYIVSKIGKSRVVHRTMDCAVLINNTDELDLVPIDPDEHELCRGSQTAPSCWRRPRVHLPPTGYLESDHGNVFVADGPEGAIASMYSKDKLGVYSLTWVASDALQDAMDKDADLESAYLNFNVALLGRGHTR
jgi:hypothetical protein